MRNALLVSLALACPMAVQAATAVCDGGTGGDKQVTAASNFIANNFTMKCSANVFLAYAESATAVGVGAASKKGKNKFSGSSAGGQVKPTSTPTAPDFCAASGCVATDASTPADNALAAAASS